VTNQDRRWSSVGATLACLCLAVGLLRAQPARSTQTAALEQEFQAAMAAQDHGDLDQAEHLLLDLRAKQPGLFPVDESLGLLYVAREQFASALPILQAAVKENPSSGLAHANLGADYLKLGKNEDAILELKIAAKMNPKDRDSRSNLGQALMSSGKAAEAAEAFSQAVQLEPENSDLRYNWAAALFDAGHVAQASEALALVPEQANKPYVQALLGEIAEKQGRFLEAAEHFQAAAKLDPSEPNLYTLGLEFLKHWNFEQSVKYFEYGVAQYPSSQRMLLGLGIARYSMPDLAQAAQIFAKLLDADPESATYADLLGKSCSRMPDMSEGCKKLEGLAERHPRNATMATYAAASILHRSDQNSDMALASKLLKQAIALDPKLAEAHFQMGVLEQYQDDWKDSVAELETAIRLRPNLSKEHYRLALAYSRTGQRDKAKAEFILMKKCSEQEKDDFNTSLKEVKTFVVATP